MKQRPKRLKKQKKEPASGKGRKVEKKLAEIGQKIHKARTRRGLSAIELAKMSGISPVQLYKIENGSNCTMKTLLKVRNSLRISITL